MNPMENTSDFMKARRSARKFTKQDVPQEDMEAIVAAGRYAHVLGYADTASGLPEHTPKERTGNRVTYVG